MVQCRTSLQLSVSMSAPHLLSPFSALSLSLMLVSISLFLPVRVDSVLVMVVVTRMLLPRSEWSSNSSTSVISLFRKYPSRDALLGYVLPRVVEPKSLDREKNATKRGRMVAIDDAVIPMPGSTVDQMDTSVLDHKKSSVSVS